MTSSRQKTNSVLFSVLLPIFILIGLVLGSLYIIRSQLGPDSSFGSAPRVGDTVSNLTLREVGNEEVSLSDYSSKILIINFWATWCEACMVEMPSLVSLREKYKNQGVEILGINLDENPAFMIPRVRKEFNISFPLLEDVESAAVDLFDIHAIPVTVILNSDRKVLAIQNGERDWNSKEVHNQIEKWLKE